MSEALVERSVSYTPEWAVQFIGDANFHWPLVCGLVAMALLLTASIIKMHMKMNAVPTPQPLAPQVDALIKALTPRKRATSY